MYELTYFFVSCLYVNRSYTIDLHKRAANSVQAVVMAHESLFQA